jgi:hypothetical protein
MANNEAFGASVRWAVKAYVVKAESGEEVRMGEAIPVFVIWV